MATVGDLPNVKAFRALQEQSRLLEQVQIVFIVGPPKCGTTWVQTTLNGHPNAVALGEGHMGTRLLSRLTGAIQSFNADHGAQAAESKHGVSPVLQLNESDTFVLARQAVDRILIHYLQAADRSGKKVIRAIMDKTPDHARQIPALATLYPWAKFICVTRDVRDAAVSAWHHRALLGTNTHATIDELAPAFAHDVWAPAMLLARRAAAENLPAGHYTEIWYEEYKKDPSGQVARLLKFVGLDDSEACVRACLDAGDFKRQTRGREAGVEARSFHRKGVVGDWQNHLSLDVARRTVGVAEAVLARGASPIDTKAMAAQPVP